MSYEEDILERLKKIIKTELGIDPKEVKGKSDLVNDLNMDSLDITELFISIEEEFDISVSAQDQENRHSIRSIVSLISNKTKNKV